jgi:hypothetical protein
MNNKCKFLIVLSLIFMLAPQVQAEKFKGSVVKNTPKDNANCFPPAKNIELSLNNVRALLKTNGTMWFKENAEYEVPKNSGKTSMFSSALWIAGVDAYGTLYVAAMKFGQFGGNDFWTGPLKMKDGSIDPATCSSYDNFYRMSRIEVERHIQGFIEDDVAYKANIPKSILEWPAHPRNMNTGESWFLAPFCKVGGGDENVYQPESGDYPYYDFQNELCPWTPENKERAKICPWLDKDEIDGGVCDPYGRIPNPKALPMPKERIRTRQDVQNYGWDNLMIYADHVLKGDETIFWLLNDKGGPHTESKGAAIGLEIRVQAFAFATNDELNNMTFYSYEIINRGSYTLSQTFFSQWADPDLGYAWDDYVGCDVNRGLGYCYNGYEIDGNGEIWAYGANPPAVGVDFFQGPYIDPDGVDNPAFDKESADINSNNSEKQEYCKRFVHYIIERFPDPDNDPDLYNKFFEVMINGKTDTLRWNDQFAINGVNFSDGIVDNERFGMRRFVFHVNDNSEQGDPNNAPEFYNLLKGKWKGGRWMAYGGNAYDSDGPVCDFMFPEGTDYCNWGTKGIDPGETYGHGGRTGNWSERHPLGPNSQPNDPHDRRFMQSAGPFTLKQGACNYITVGIPWARATQGGVEASIRLLMIADDKCQALFENCFKLIDGPDAPTLTIREYDQKLIILISNSPLGNNANESYSELDGQIPEFRVDVIKEEQPINPGSDTVVISYRKDTVYYDRYYRFEGYQIFQVKGPEVGSNDLDKPDLARLVSQFDIENYDKFGNPIGTLINWEFNEEMQLAVPTVKVVGANIGIKHSIEITQDLFATEEKQLVNYKTYYFIGIAYAYNQYWPFKIDVLGDPEKDLLGQRFPYLKGRKTAEGGSVTPVKGIPHPPELHGGVLTLNSEYGSIPNITRIDGHGNGGIALDLTQKTIDKIVEGGDNGDYRVRELQYEKNAGPLNIKVVDPLRVKPFDYTFYIKDPFIDSLELYKRLNKEDSIKAYKKRLDDTDVTDRAFWVLSIDNTTTDKELQEILLTHNGKKDGYPIREFVSKTNIGQYYEEIIFPLGISVAVTNINFSSKQPSIIDNWQKILNDLALLIPSEKHRIYKLRYLFCQPDKIDIKNDVVFSNNGSKWITGLADDNVKLPSNWIRAGIHNLGQWASDNSLTETVSKNYSLERLEDAFYPSNLITNEGSKGRAPDRAFKDYTGKFSTLCEGTWAPYVLTSPYDGCPQARFIVPDPLCDTNGLSIYDNKDREILKRQIHDYYNFSKLSSFPPEFQPGYNQTMTNLYSVNIVLTPDKNLWSRCIVLESCEDSTKSIGSAVKNEPRKSKSVGKDGKPDNSTDGFGEYGDEGMGWFPGYAINIETGERLNIMFSENSDTTLRRFDRFINGRDMIFNPTSTYAIATKDTLVRFAEDLNLYFYSGQEISQNLYNFLFNYFDRFSGLLKTVGIERIWGGKHYVYVCGSSGNTSPIYYLNSGVPGNFLKEPRRNFNLNDTIFNLSSSGGIHGGFLDPITKQYPFYDLGPYDEGKWLVEKFKFYFNFEWKYRSNLYKHKMQLFNNVMYTYIPMLPTDSELQKEWMSCDVTFKIRVTRPYLRYISRWYESPELRDKDYTVPEEFNNYGFPVYKLSTKELAPTINDTRLFQSTLDNINIVPNPYYGGSFYERNALETKVKITNLPTDLKNNAPITINIFTVNGILVRTLTKGDNLTSYLDWDLKNYANIPVAGGVYIIHVNIPGIGERMLKFFCTMRPTDLNNF